MCLGCGAYPNTLVRSNHLFPLTRNCHFTCFMQNPSNMTHPPTKKKLTTKTCHHCANTACGNCLDPSDGHNRCYVCFCDRNFIPHKKVKCPQCLSFNVCSCRARERKWEDYLEVARKARERSCCTSLGFPLPYLTPPPSSKGCRTHKPPSKDCNCYPIR